MRQFAQTHGAVDEAGDPLVGRICRAWRLCPRLPFRLHGGTRVAASLLEHNVYNETEQQGVHECQPEHI
eukprot:7646896-Lingulodinium_polyedra.AAC.1